VVVLAIVLAWSLNIEQVRNRRGEMATALTSANLSTESQLSATSPQACRR
jgi:hypothetical protein